MAQFVFDSDLHALLQLDTPIPNAPPARWQRKAKEAAGPAPSPMRAANRSHTAGRTPGRTPGQWERRDAGRENALLTASCMSLLLPRGPSRTVCFPLPTLGKSSSKIQTTPSKPGGDRYIPHRSATQMEVASFLLSKENHSENSQTPTKKVGAPEGLEAKGPVCVFCIMPSCLTHSPPPFCARNIRKPGL